MRCCDGLEEEKEEEGCLRREWQRQSDPLAKSSGKERKRPDIWFQGLASGCLDSGPQVMRK